MRKAQAVLFVMFFVFAIVIVLLTALLSPMATRFTTESIVAGEKIMENSQDRLDQINDSAIRNSVNSSIQGALDNADNNIGITTGAYKYMWVLVVGLGALTLFLLARSFVQVGGGGLI